MGAVELRLVLDAERGEVVGKKCAVAFFFVGVVEAGEAVAELVEAAVVDAAVELFQHEFGARNQADLQVVKLRQARGGGAVEILRDRPCVVKADVVGGVALGQVAGVVGGFGVKGEAAFGGVCFRLPCGCAWRQPENIAERASFAQKRNIRHRVHQLRQFVQQIQTVLLHSGIIRHHHHIIKKRIHLRFYRRQRG